jgi:hypothetical protein
MLITSTASTYPHYTDHWFSSPPLMMHASPWRHRDDVTPHAPTRHLLARVYYWYSKHVHAYPFSLV